MKTLVLAVLCLVLIAPGLPKWCEGRQLRACVREADGQWYEDWSWRIAPEGWDAPPEAPPDGWQDEAVWLSENPPDWFFEQSE